MFKKKRIAETQSEREFTAVLAKFVVRYRATNMYVIMFCFVDYFIFLTRLGSVHDGQGPAVGITNHPGALRPECAWELGFIMSYVEHPTNSYLFSLCTYEQIVFTLKYVTAK